MTTDEIKETVYGFQTAHEEGFTIAEAEQLSKLINNLNASLFQDHLDNLTTFMRGSENLIYSHDVVKAIKAGLGFYLFEDRKHDLSLFNP